MNVQWPIANTGGLGALTLTQRKLLELSLKSPGNSAWVYTCQVDTPICTPLKTLFNAVFFVFFLVLLTGKKIIHIPQYHSLSIRNHIMDTIIHIFHFKTFLGLSTDLQLIHLNG